KKETTKIRLEHLEIFPMQRKIFKSGKTVHLTNLEYEFMLMLVENPERYFTREELLKKIWNQRGTPDEKVISVLVGRLRDKIEKDPKHPRIVETVRGIGYALGVEVEYF
ncbi:MAG: response regulator transcription factor, partial [Bifidobacteriaceae bacterium]|nr:response regulator transcription factor [Bifidobacteriaceae bacterium]